MPIAALFTTARWWKPLKCPLTDDWINQMWHIYMFMWDVHSLYVECYLVLKRKGILIYATTWMNLEKGQTAYDSTYEVPRTVKFRETEVQQWLPGARGGRETGSYHVMGTGVQFCKTKSSVHVGGDGSAAMSTYSMALNCTLKNC